MLLPAGEQAVVEDAKLLDYVLNPEHPIGRHHAGLFEVSRVPSVRSSRCVPVQGPIEKRPVLAVWMRADGRTTPRLIMAGLRVREGRLSREKPRGALPARDTLHEVVKDFSLHAFDLQAIA